MWITLREYEKKPLSPGILTDEQISRLAGSYPKQVALIPPGFGETGWRVRNEGWVGAIPLGDGAGVHLTPKVPITNVLRMLEVVWNLTGLRFPDGVFDAATIADFYERFAIIFAKRVTQRCARGIYRTYVEEQADLVAVRGRVQVHEAMARPARVRLPCRFEEFTADIDENRILAFALEVIRRCGLCTEAHSLPAVRKAHQLITMHASPTPFAAEACLGRNYNRLNDDYRLLHALAHFFIAHTGPTTNAGGRQTTPFLLDMALLFQEYVAAFLRDAIGVRHLPLHFRPQVPVKLDTTAGVGFLIDGVLRMGASDGPVQTVLDTKYKAPDTPDTDDIAQVIAYAHVLGAAEAVLVYPGQIANPIDFLSHGIRVRSIVYSLEGDLADAGIDFMHHLLDA